MCNVSGSAGAPRDGPYMKELLRIDLSVKKTHT